MNPIIEAKDVTPVNLAIELERAVIEHRLEDDQSIYVTEDGWFPYWLRVLDGAGYVSFKTHTHFKKSTTHLQRLEICNELNRHNYLITAHVADDRLLIDWVLSLREGVIRENFVRSCRQFASNIDRGLAKADPTNDFVLRPGQTESADETNE